MTPKKPRRVRKVDSERDAESWIERCAKYLLESHAIHGRIGVRRLTYEELGRELGFQRGKTLDFEGMRAELAEIERLASDAEKPAIDLEIKFARGELEPYVRIVNHVAAARKHLTQAVVEMRLADNVIRNEMRDRGLARYEPQRSAVRLAMARFPPTANAREVLPIAKRIILKARLDTPTDRSLRNWFNAEREAETGKQLPKNDG